MKIEFDVTYQNIERSDRNHVVADSKNYLQAEFNFQTAEWIGKTKTAIFARLGLIKNVILESDDTCMVPWEMLKTGSFTVSVFAGDLITASTGRRIWLSARRNAASTNTGCVYTDNHYD